jgi:hypothetical protein
MIINLLKINNKQLIEQNIKDNLLTLALYRFSF